MPPFLCLQCNSSAQEKSVTKSDSEIVSHPQLSKFAKLDYRIPEHIVGVGGALVDRWQSRSTPPPFEQPRLYLSPG